jgi:TonB-linked SusC/RagA family outer membrane protein
MKRFFTTIPLLALFLGPVGLLAQMAISGKVTDAGTGEALIGATVMIKGQNSGAATNQDGQYRIQAKGDDVLVVSYTGYQRQEIPVDKRTSIDILLSESESQLDELVVVGYGVQRKSQITGAIASINNKDFKDQPVSNLASSIQGRVTGLNVSTPSGTPGAGLLVSVRGNNAPLYVVDGIPLLAESNSALSTSFNTSGETVGQGQTLSSAADINPNDIESIEILKDASAAAIYGARAANGVILITTKRGKEGKSEANFNYYTGVQQVARKMEFLSSQQWVDLIEEGRSNDLAKYQADPNYFGPDFDPSVLTEPLENFDLSSGTNTRWLDEVTRTAPISNYEASLRGGNDKTRFFTSAGFYDQRGIVIENFYKRFTYRLNLDHQINNKLTVGTSVNTTFSRNRRSFNDDTYTGIITNALGASPLMPVYDENGDYTSFEDYQASWLSDNPVKSAKEIRAYTNTYRLMGTVFADYAIAPALKFRTSWSTDATFLFDNQFKSPLTADAEAVGGEAFESNFRNLTWLNENTLNYTKTAGRHSFNLLGGATFQQTKLGISTVTGQGFPPGGLERVSSAANIISATSAGGGFGLVSFIGRVNYGFDNRYLLTLSGRSDGSSRFSKDNRFGFFPSAALAWRLTGEPFFQQKFFSDLKMRVSYGLTGDQEIGDYQNVAFYTASRYDGLPGLQLRNIADPSLSWQSNRSFNVGLDYEIKGGRFAGALEFFNATKTRLLSQDVIQGTTGFSTVTRNSGEVQNLGVEFSIRAAAVHTSRLRWDVQFNATWLHNEIKKLTSDGVYLNAYNDLEATHILKVGQPIGSFIGLKYLGVDPETGDAQFEDTNGDGNIDYDDAQIIGKALPSWFGGLTNTFAYGQFDLSIFARFSQGNQVYNLIRSVTENLGYSNDGGLSSVYSNNTVNVLNRWKKPGDVAEYGRASFIYGNFYQNSSQMVENGSFIRIQNVTLGWTIPGKRLHGSRIYLEGQNLYLFSKYKGFDPEVSSNGGLSDRTAGVDYGAYPQARTLLVGFNLKF